MQPRFARHLLTRSALKLTAALSVVIAMFELIPIIGGVCAAFAMGLFFSRAVVSTARGKIQLPSKGMFMEGWELLGMPLRALSFSLPWIVLSLLYVRFAVPSQLDQWSSWRWIPLGLIAAGWLFTLPMTLILSTLTPTFTALIEPHLPIALIRAEPKPYLFLLRRTAPLILLSVSLEALSWQLPREPIWLLLNVPIAWIRVSVPTLAMMTTGWFLFEHAQDFGFSHPDLLGEVVWPDARPGAQTARSSRSDHRSEAHPPATPKPAFLASDRVIAAPTTKEDSLELELPD